MSIPMNDLRRRYQRHEATLSRVATEVMGSGYWINGPHTRDFCAAFAAAVGVAHCIGVANGSDALEIALRCLLTEERNEVITAANAGGYTTIACRLLDCVPVYADIDEASQLIAIDSAVQAVGPRTAAIVVTHLYGGLVDVPALRAALTAAGHGSIPIVEDCAQAHGLRGCGGTAGGFGDMATFSFYPTKNLGALGDGGAIVTNDPTLAEKAARLRMYGWGAKYDVVTAGGRNSRLDEVQAALLSALLPHLDADNERRRAIVGRYAAMLPADVRIVSSPNGNVGHLAVVMSEDRDRLASHLTEQQVATDIHFPILDCDQAAWRDGYRIGSGDLETSRRSVKKILSLPCFPEMTDDEVSHVCDALASYRA